MSVYLYKLLRKLLHPWAWTAIREISHLTKLKVGRSPRERAFEIALAAEESAVRFYRRLAESTQDEELRVLYEEFVIFEENHSGWLEQKVAQVRRTSGSTKRA